MEHKAKPEKPEWYKRMVPKGPKGFFTSTGSQQKISTCFVTVSSKMTGNPKATKLMKEAIVHAIKQGVTLFHMGAYKSDLEVAKIIEELGAKVKIQACFTDNEDPEIWANYGPVKPQIWGYSSLERDFHLMDMSGYLIALCPRNSLASNPGYLVTQWVRRQSKIPKKDDPATEALLGKLTISCMRHATW